MIRAFLQRRRERKYWATRLDGAIDRMIVERDEAMVQQDVTVPFTAPPNGMPDADQKDVDQADWDTTMFEDMTPETECNSAGGAAEEDESLQTEEGELPEDAGMLFPPLSIDAMLAEIMEHDSVQDFAERVAELHANEVIVLPQTSFEDLDDAAVDELVPKMFEIVQRHREGRSTQVTQSLAPRRKNIDPRATVKRMARGGGHFNGFSYRPSPSEQVQSGERLRLLVIADVSGSMGRYVGVLLYLLACLEEIATIDSYVFSDATTYASGLLGTGNFQEQFARLKEGAASWEYGTQLNLALQDVLRDGRFGKDTRAVLITDGGFSLVGEDWEETVRGICELREKVESLCVITPHHELAEDGPACAEALWNVEREPRKGHELVGPLQKTARFGLLARYSNQLLLCQTPDDFARVIGELLQHEGHQQRPR